MLFPYSEIHEMQGTFRDGNVTWFCPECGRKIQVVIKPPSKIVITEGDPSAAHRGGMGGLQISYVGVSFNQRSNNHQDAGLNDPTKSKSKPSETGR